MPVNIERNEIRFRNSILNSKYFKGNYYNSLIGCVGINYYIEQFIDLSWDAELGVDQWELKNNRYNSNKLQRVDGGDFSNDGFSVGDSIIFGTVVRIEIVPIPPFNIFAIRQYYQIQTTITSVDGDTITLSDNINLQKLADDLKANPLYDNAYITNKYESFVSGVSDINGFQLNYGFVENAERYSDSSIVDGTNLGWYTPSIQPPNTTTTLTPVNDSIKSNKTSRESSTIVYKGRVQKEFIIDGIAYGVFSVSQYILYQVTQIPSYIEAWLTNIQNSTKPTELNNESSLKYVCQLNFYNSLAEAQTKKSKTFDKEIGNIGWTNELYNGGKNDYEVISISYTDLNDDPIDKIDIAGCKFTLKVKSNNHKFSTTNAYKRYFNLIHESLKNASEYENNEYYYNNNILRDNVDVQFGGTGYDGNLFKDLVCTADSDYEATITGRLDYTYYNLNFADKVPNEGDLYRFMVVCSTNNIILGTDSSSTDVEPVGALDQVVLLDVDINTYIKNTDIPNLWNHDRFEIFDHPTQIGSYTNPNEGYTGFSGWIEDGIVIYAKKQLKRGAYVRSLKAAFVAEKQSDKSYFIIDEYNVDTSTQVFPTGAGSGYTQWNVNELSRYNLNPNDQFNRLVISTSGTASTYAPISLFIPYKIPYQSWQKLETADTVFYENNPSNEYGLNKNSSRYSGEEGYEVKVYLIADIEYEGVITQYIDRSPSLDINYYDLPSGFTNTISTETEDAVDLQGAIRTDQNTVVKATFNKVSHGLNVNELYGIIRIETQRAQGDGIYEISTINEGFAQSPLIPITGNYASISVDADNVIVSCKIDYTKIGSEPYRISAKIGAKESAPFSGDYNNDYNNDYDNL